MDVSSGLIFLKRKKKLSILLIISRNSLGVLFFYF